MFGVGIMDYASFVQRRMSESCSIFSTVILGRWCESKSVCALLGLRAAFSRMASAADESEKPQCNFDIRTRSELHNCQILHIWMKAVAFDNHCINIIPLLFALMGSSRQILRGG